jgi:hypothetical protein
MSVNRLLVASLVAGLSLVGVVLIRASIPSPSGVIFGCFDRSSGSLRVIDNATTTCKPEETQLTWNQTGPQGPIGHRVRRDHRVCHK